MKIFDKIKVSAPRLNKFDLGHEKKLSLNMGQLIPIVIQDIVPGDKFRVSSEIMLRMAPMLAPIMHRVNVTTHYFFVPNRLVWDEWEDFITGGREGTLQPEWPTVPINEETRGTGIWNPSQLPDYFNIPPIPNVPVANPMNISALPFRAYQLIWDEYYRDQNLTPSLDISKSSGVQTTAETEKICAIRNRAWEKDYFTSALPWAQRGPSVDIPIEGQGTVTYKPVTELRSNPSGNPLEGTLEGDMAGNLQANPGGIYGRVENIDEVDVSSAGFTITALRYAVRLQEWLEKNARGGARYVEQILSHFGVVSSDARLQRPEYLGGGKSPVVISEVLQTAQSDTDPLATMAGHGVSVGRTNGFQRRFEEHGYVIGLMSVLPRTTYQNGIPRHFFRSDKFKYFWPEFANIGEQEIERREIWYDATDPVGGNTETFGYTPRYSEYKYAPSTVHGTFRTSLSYWHMGRIFTAIPQLNTSFVTAVPTKRIFAVEDAPDTLYCQIYNRIDALRPMPYFGTPTL